MSRLSIVSDRNFFFSQARDSLDDFQANNVTTACVSDWNLGYFDVRKRGYFPTLASELRPRKQLNCAVPRGDGYSGYGAHLVFHNTLERLSNPPMIYSWIFPCNNFESTAARPLIRRTYEICSFVKSAVPWDCFVCERLDDYRYRYHRYIRRIIARKISV